MKETTSHTAPRANPSEAEPIRLASVDPETLKSIDECVSEMVELHKSGKMRGIVMYALEEDDVVVTRSSANLSTREIIGALNQLAYDMHIAMREGA